VFVNQWTLFILDRFGSLESSPSEASWDILIWLDMLYANWSINNLFFLIFNIFNIKFEGLLIIILLLFFSHNLPFAKSPRLVLFGVLVLLPLLAVAILQDPAEIEAVRDMCLSWKNSTAPAKGYFGSLNCTNSTDLALFCDKSYPGISCNAGNTSVTDLCDYSHWLSDTLWILPSSLVVRFSASAN